MTGHTPTPWRVENENAIRGTWEDGTPVQIAVMFPTRWTPSGDPTGTKTRRMAAETDVNAAFLVRACNNHAVLLAALYALTEAITYRGGKGLGSKVVTAYMQARDVLERNRR